MAFRLAPPSFLGESSRRWCTISGRRSGRSTTVVQPQQRSVLFSSRSYPSINQNETTTTATPFLSNQELVQRRLEVRRAQKEARERSVQERAARNWQVKRLLHTSGAAAEADHLQATSTTTCAAAHASQPLQNPPFLYALKVSVCEDLRRELKLSGREKRGRVFVSSDNQAAVQSLAGLRAELFAFFRALRKGTFTLSAGYCLNSPMNTTLENDDTSLTTEQWWPVESDEDVQTTFRRALGHFEQQQQQQQQQSRQSQQDSSNSSVLKRPTILLHVQRDPNAPPPPPPPAYLENMSDPAQSPTMTMLSFYAFPPGGIPDPEDFAAQLRKVWKPFHALGRVYVAHEGVNAQMSVPTTVLPNFMDCCRSMEYLGAYMENGINIDPIPLSQEEFQRAGLPQAKDGTPTPPFTNLHVRVRQQVVADGWLGDPTKQFDWQSAGYDMPPLEWHEKLKQARDLQQRGQKAHDAPLILDCRNAYETQVGRFEGAEPLNTENFRESWDVLAERLANLPKDAPIMTYCTGGIRCVKVGAYLTQELGFTNVSRLAGGIIAYDRALQLNASENEESMFKGTNFVFDGRLGRPITEDALGVCHTCGSETSLVSNCRNDNCHKRMIQCEDCRTSFHGTCSEACRNRLVNGAMLPLRAGMTTRANAGEMQQSFTTLSAYSVGHSSPSPSIYKEIEFNTKTLIPSGSHMVSGESQGRLLTQLASMTREGRVLELGTFTGYATACLLEGVANAAELIRAKMGGRQSGPYVLSMERDIKAYEVASAHLKIVAEHGFGEEAAEQLCALRARPTTLGPVDETVSLQYKDGLVGFDLVLVSDALALLEEMAAGRGDLLPAPFDMVFVDADKTRLLEYVDACLSSDLLLKKGGLIIVDNVLWKGLVLEASGTGGQLQEEIDSEDDSMDEREELRKNRRARRLANKMHRFNQGIVQDHRAEVLILPIRDGLSLIRKK